MFQISLSDLLILLFYLFMLNIQKYIGNPEIIIHKIDSLTTKFEIKYLPRGFGHTLGNSIRRLVLGYAAGGSVTGLKIKWIPHEYSVVEWLKDSVIDMMLAFKQLRFSLVESEDTVNWINQKFTKVSTITAADLKLPSGIEVINSEVYLFEITAPTDLYIEYRIEKGYGYFSIDYLRSREKKSDDTDVNLLLIDNEFGAVKYCSYQVEEVIDDFTGGLKDKLIIEIQSISSFISPEDIIAFSGEVLSSYAKLFVFTDAFIDQTLFLDENHVYDEPVKSSSSLVRTQPIEILWLSERTRNALLKNSILFIEDLEKKKKSELITMRWVWKKAVDEIEDALKIVNKSLL